MPTQTARGIRNNNPGNIRIGSPWAGLAEQQLDPEFCTFQRMAWGIRALIVLLQIYRERYGLVTVRGIINRWAPSSENDTEAYIQAVCKAANLTPDTLLPDERTTYEYLVWEIAKHENGQDANLITKQQWQEGFDMVYGDRQQVIEGI